MVVNTYKFEQYRQSADFFEKKLDGFRPEILVILGSGLGALGECVEEAVYVEYEDVPNMKKSTAPGHKGRFVFGRLSGRNVAVMQGRLHAYEGWSFADIAYPVRVMRLLGADKMIITNASGAINPDFKVGDIMLIRDHIKLFLPSPLTGENTDEFGPRFSDMSHIYTTALQETARLAAAETGVKLREGVYMYFPGPQYETPAEIKAAGILGADAVGMSTIPESITAAHCGMQVLGFSLCTNMAAGVLDVPLSGDEVIAAGNAAAPVFATLIEKCIGLM